MSDLESHDPDEAFTEAMADARIRLEPPVVRDRVWPALAAAALFAVSALILRHRRHPRPSSPPDSRRQRAGPGLAAGARLNP